MRCTENNRDDGSFQDVTEKREYPRGMDMEWESQQATTMRWKYRTSTLLNTDKYFVLQQGDGTFTDVTETAGVAAEGWSSSAVWFDYDNDGKLDCSFANCGIRPVTGCGVERDGTRSLLHSPNLQGGPLALPQQRRTALSLSKQGIRNRRASGRLGVVQRISTTTDEWTCSVLQTILSRILFF